MSDVAITFLGASGTVTGSKYLVEAGNVRILVDCGMFQGEREWRVKNWDDPPVSLRDVHAVLLTHAHIDHIGMLPRFRTFGLDCPIYATPASVRLTRLLLPDSGRLQEEEAEYRARRGRSRHNPPKPLYTEQEAVDVLPLLKEAPFDLKVEIAPGVTALWRRMGHIIGAGAIELRLGDKLVTFSGDVGRYDVPILRDPQPVQYGDLLLIESTYGDTVHGAADPKAALGDVVREAVRRDGIVLVPSFAVGRTQQLLYYLRELKEEGAIPDIPVIVDSPMASDATGLYVQSPDDYDEEALGIAKRGAQPFSLPKLHFIRDRNESKELNNYHEPMVLISASGMLSGGRVLHHLKHRLGDPRNTILFVGYQPPGGRGDWIKRRSPDFRIFGDPVAIRAHVAEMSGMSAHGDQSELLRWCRSGTGVPKRVAVVHGEPPTREIFARKLEEELGWKTFLPRYLERVVV